MNKTDKDRIAELEREVAELKRQLADVLRDRGGVRPAEPRPLFPLLPPDNGWEPPVKPQCGGCGLVMEGTIMYCCPRHDCPSGLGPTICSVDVSGNAQTFSV